MKCRLAQALLPAVFLLGGRPAWSMDVDTVLAAEEAPAGVVFELISGEPGSLGPLLAGVRKDIQRLRERFPQLPVAVVSHGYEQFDLLKDHRVTAAKSHEAVQQLVQSDEVELHVCGTHAGWYGHTPEDFPEYVDVSPAGPAQINDYENLGYTVIVRP